MATRTPIRLLALPVMLFLAGFTASQRGFVHNLNTGTYTFLDEPAEQFPNGVELTQITGVTNSGEIAGFYSGPGGNTDGFIRCQVNVKYAGSSASVAPEPGSFLLAGMGLSAFAFIYLAVMSQKKALTELFRRMFDVVE